MTGRLKGRVALITGAGRGIGRATALLFAKEGAVVIATDLDRNAQAHLAPNLGPGCFIVHDVASEDDWQRIIAQISDRYGRLNVLVNNAGIGRSGPVTAMSLVEWRQVMAVNLDSVFLALKHALPLLRASGGGSVVNVSSIAGIKPSANSSAYAASKGGVRMLTKAIALECATAGDGVRVNSIHPGIVETAIWDDLLASSTPRGHPADRNLVLGQMAATNPLGRNGTVEEIAQGILWLAGDDSSFVTGAELVIDGGRSIN